MPAGHRETAYAIPSVGPAVFSLELVLKVKVTAMDRCAFDELVMTLPSAVRQAQLRQAAARVEVST